MTRGPAAGERSASAWSSKIVQNPRGGGKLGAKDLFDLAPTLHVRADAREGEREGQDRGRPDQQLAPNRGHLGLSMV